MAKWRFPAWLTAVVLAGVALALYWPATGYDYVSYDDDLYVTANVHVQSRLTWESIKWACLNPVVANWHPLTVLSHMLVWQVFGSNPWGHHLTNVLLHALNAGLVFALLHLMTGAAWRSLLVAALFAVHPLRVESVAWVSERKDVLSTFFGLLALIAYARYAKDAEGRMQNEECGSPKAEGPKPATPLTFHVSRFMLHESAFYLLSLFFFALGLLSKPMLVSWPFVMLLLDYWPLGRMQNGECRMKNAEATGTSTLRSTAEDGHHAPHITHHASQLTAQSQIANRKSQILFPLLLEKLPFFALSATASVVTLVVQQRGGSLAPGDKLALSARLANALISYCRYLAKLFCPADLAIFYPHPGRWPLGKVLVAGGVILGISMLVWSQRRRAPFLLMGWLWYCGMLVPMIGLVQTGGQAMADRHTYLPSIGVLILMIWGAYELTRRWRYRVLALSVAGAAEIILCLVLTRHQLGHWRDSEALFRHALAVTKNNWLAHDSLGSVLGRKGQTDEAIRHFQEAIRLKPDHANAHHNLGNALLWEGRIDEAIGQYRETIRLKPDRAEAHNSLGIAFGIKGQISEAIERYQEAIRLKPDYAEARNNLGNAFGMKGQTDQAIGQFQEAIRLKPDYAEAHNGLGIAFGMKGQADEAISQFHEAIRLKPDYAEAHYRLGGALGMKGQIGEAISQFQEVTRLQPDSADAHNILGVALDGKGAIDEAINEFREALRLKPDYADARNNLDVALAKKGHSLPQPGASTKP